MKWLCYQKDSVVWHGHVAENTVTPVGLGDLMSVIQDPVPPSEHSVTPLALDSVEPLAPLLAPGKIIAVAANYQKHVRESGFADRDAEASTPYLFLKPTTSIVGTQQKIPLPRATDQLDWEVELAVIVGKSAFEVSESESLGYVFGYTTANDISGRRIIPASGDRGPQAGFFDWLKGKYFDYSTPMGPMIITADEVPDPQTLPLSLTVNGVEQQSGSTCEMIHSVAYLLSYISSLMTLNPGDVILTGTPAGVGLSTGTFLRPGDIIHAEVAQFGPLVSTITSPRDSRTNKYTHNHWSDNHESNVH